MSDTKVLISHRVMIFKNLNIYVYYAGHWPKGMVYYRYLFMYSTLHRKASITNLFNNFCIWLLFKIFIYVSILNFIFILSFCLNILYVLWLFPYYFNIFLQICDIYTYIFIYNINAWRLCGSICICVGVVIYIIVSIL